MTTVGDYHQSHEVIGRGGFGMVYKGYHQDTGEVVAIKVIEIRKLLKKTSREKAMRFLRTEVDYLHKINHGNVVRLLYASYFHEASNDTPTQLKLVFEYCESDFDKYLKQQKMNYKQKSRRTVLSEDEIRYWMRQLICGLYCIHEQHQLIHRDLKHANILLKLRPNSENYSGYEKYELKIADLGLSKPLANDEMTKTYVGTPQYMAPEIKTGIYGKRADLWSVGIVLGQMITGNILQLNEKIDVRELIIQNHTVSDQCLDLVHKLLTYDYRQRVDCSDVKDHPFLQLKSESIMLSSSSSTSSSSSLPEPNFSGEIESAVEDDLEFQQIVTKAVKHDEKRATLYSNGEELTVNFRLIPNTPYMVFVHNTTNSTTLNCQIETQSGETITHIMKNSTAGGTFAVVEFNCDYQETTLNVKLQRSDGWGDFNSWLFHPLTGLTFIVQLYISSK